MFLLKLAPKEDRPHLKRIGKAFLVLITLSAIVLMLAGCQKTALSEKPTANQQFKVELLFEVDGCKIYRFVDGYTQYFTTCEGSTTAAHNETCGKGCLRTRHTKVETKKKGYSCDAREHDGR